MTGRLFSWAFLTLAFYSLFLLPGMAKEPARSGDSTPAQPSGWIQRLRQLLHLQPTEAVGGSRGQPGSSLCLLSPIAAMPPPPGTANDGQSGTLLLVATATPMLVTSEPLNEVVLEANDIVLWQDLASSRQSLPQVRPWPIQSLQPGQELSLKLRPEGSSGSDYVIHRLRLADPATLARARGLQDELRANPAAWQTRLQQATQRGDRDTAALLLSSPIPWQGMTTTDLQQLCARP